YGAPLPTFTVSYKGFVKGDGAGSLGGTLSFTTTATASSHVAGSPYLITPTGLNSTDYSITFADGHLTVTPAALAVSADNESEDANGPAPSFVVSYSGFVNGDTAAALSGTLTFNTKAITGDSFAIMPSGLTSTDYHITYLSGDLTVIPAAA